VIGGWWWIKPLPFTPTEKGLVEPDIQGSEVVMFGKTSLSPMLNVALLSLSLPPQLNEKAVMPGSEGLDLPMPDVVMALGAIDKEK
jgi:hypothetical protein